MLTSTDFHYYLPRYKNNGAIPGFLKRNQAFVSEQAAIDWMEEHLDGEREVDIKERKNSDIPNVEIIDFRENPLPKIESLSTEEIENVLIKAILHDYQCQNLKVERDKEETFEAYSDRVYGRALDLVNETIGNVEEELEYDFSSFGGNPDTDWFDEAREGVMTVVMRWMFGTTD